MSKSTITFDGHDHFNDTSFFLSRQATFSVAMDDSVTGTPFDSRVPYLPIKFSYIIDGILDEGGAATPRIIDVEIEEMESIDDWAYAKGLSEEEHERRMNIRESIYAAAEDHLRRHYGLEPHTTKETSV